MTESEWLSSSDPAAMLSWLGAMPAGGTDAEGRAYEVRVSDRKLRLFACACVRQVWHLLAFERSRQAVEVAERFADGQATAADLDAARDAAWAAARDAAWDAARAAKDAAWAARAAARDAAWDAARDAARDAAWAAAWDASRAKQAALLRDVVGNPWRPPVLVIGTGSAAYRQVLTLARAAYDDRREDGTLDPVTLAVLADALEEAGCGQADLLRHLRGEERCARCVAQGLARCTVCRWTGWQPLRGPHVRGCWAVDRVLGRE